MAKAFFGTKISANLALSPEGYLIAPGVTIARTGMQRYAVEELPADRVKALGITGNGYVDVYRSPEAVFDRETISSAEGKAITLFHPPSFVVPDNYQDYARGHLQNVRKGSAPLESGDWPLVADLLIMEAAAIAAVDGGTRELSAGYSYDLELDGDILTQQNIIINHVAIVPSARAGSEARINDAAEFKEQEHPREETGKFTSGGGGGASSKSGGESESGASATPSSGGRGAKSAHLVPAPADRGEWPDHIKKLKVPPAWKDVRISQDPDAALQALGQDSKGRTVPIYSAKFSEGQAAKKFARIKELDGKFDKIRKQNAGNLKSEDPKVRENAECAALVMAMGIRPGSDTDTKAKVKAYGATTLQGQHVVAEGNKTFLRFTGKKGVAINLPVEDAGLAASLSARAKTAGPDGKLFPAVSDKSLLAYSHTLDGGGFKTKDFRTLLASREAMQQVHPPPPKDEKEYKLRVLEVAKHVSSKLGNTPTVALQSYIPPEIFAPWSSALGMSGAGDSAPEESTGELPDVRFGDVPSSDIDWRAGEDDSPDDDEQLAETPEDVIEMLGFDPEKESHANDAAPLAQNEIHIDIYETPGRDRSPKERKYMKVTNALKHVFGLGVMALAKDEGADPETLADAVTEMSKLENGAKDESEEEKKKREAESKAKDAAEEARKRDDEFKSMQEKGAKDEATIASLSKELDDMKTKAKDAEAVEPKHFQGCAVDGCSARGCRMHDALDEALNAHPEDEDADMKELADLIDQFKSDDMAPIDENSEVIEPIEESGGDRSMDAATVLELSELKKIRTQVARSGDRAKIADFNARLQKAQGRSASGSGGYAEFANATNGRGHDDGAGSIDTMNAALEAKARERRGKPC